MSCFLSSFLFLRYGHEECWWQNNAIYNFTEILSNEFETINPNISLTIFDENKNRIYTSRNNSTTKAQIVKLQNNNRYAALKPFKNKFVKLDEILRSFSEKGLKEYLINRIATLKKLNAHYMRN